MRELLRVHFEVVACSPSKLLDAEHLHAAADAAHQARALVAAEVEAAALLQVVEQGLEAGVVASRALMQRARRVTRVTQRRRDLVAAAGRNRRTPVCCAASGMPKNSEVFSSCTITVPPIFLIAFTPMAPSLPVPESTTAMARSL